MAHKTLTGKMSTFGGPDDTGVSPSEGLALCEPHEIDLFPEILFLPEQPPGTTGLARRLNPQAFYVAARWNYDITPRDFLQNSTVIVTNPKTGRVAKAWPIDWGPHVDTNRICDLSPGLAADLGLNTDDQCAMRVPLPPEIEVETHGHICISSGHGLHIRGASGSPVPPQLDEVDEARRVVEAVAAELKKRNVDVETFHDNTSHDQSTNLATITNWHNSCTRDLDISVHFNAYDGSAHGVEVLYVTQNDLANKLSSAISHCGFTNRGGKKRTDLYFLNNTHMPAVLIETCFCDNTADSETYRNKFDQICKTIATVLGGVPARKKKNKRK